MQDRFQTFPKDMLCYIFLFLPNDLATIQFVTKRWKLLADELLYKPDLITSLCEDLSVEHVKNIINTYKESTAYQLVSAISPDKRNAWQTLTCIIVDRIVYDASLLARAFLTVASRLSVAGLGRFITNFRTTEVCKSFLLLPYSKTDHFRRLSEGLLCDNVMKLKSSELTEAVRWANDHLAGSEYKQLLHGIKVALLVSTGKKNIPYEPCYYINLRGADLKNANLTNTDFHAAYVDLSEADLSCVKFSNDKSISRYILINIGLYIFCYVRDKLFDMSQVALPVRVMLGVLSATTQYYYICMAHCTDHSDLSCVNLRNANLWGAEVGGCRLDNSLMTKARLDWTKNICYASMNNVTLLDEDVVDNIDDILTKLKKVSCVPHIKNRVADNILSLAQSLPKERAVNLLESAVAHPFFTKSSSIINWAGAGLPVTEYMLSFFRRVPNHLERFKRALDELKTQPELIKTDRGLKRKFSII